MIYVESIRLLSRDAIIKWTMWQMTKFVDFFLDICITFNTWCLNPNSSIILDFKVSTSFHAMSKPNTWSIQLHFETPVCLSSIPFGKATMPIKPVDNFGFSIQHLYVWVPRLAMRVIVYAYWSFILLNPTSYVFDEFDPPAKHQWYDKLSKHTVPRGTSQKLYHSSIKNHGPVFHLSHPSQQNDAHLQRITSG